MIALEKDADWSDHEILEQTVLRGTKDDLSELLKASDSVGFTAKALGMACRFKGLETVKLLAENGASFKYKLRQTVRGVGVYLPDENYSLALLSRLNLGYLAALYYEGKNRCELLPLKDRLEVLEYLFDNADKVGFKPDEFLFFAILADEAEMVSYLKNKGVKVSEKWAKTAAEGSIGNEWYDFVAITHPIDSERLIPILDTLISEMRQVIEFDKLHFTEWLLNFHGYRFSDPEFFKFFLNNFNQKKMNKTKLMKILIELDWAPSLAAAAANGWLKQPKKRDEMIKYAADNGKTECTAFLLDFKNRTADLKAEREKADKKAEKELNAGPNSPAYLKRIKAVKRKKEDKNAN